MKYLNTNEIQNILMEMLVKLEKIFGENDIRYTLDGGTLLGAVRHGGFIPWDDDIDLLVPRPDFERLCDNPSLAPAGYSLDVPGMNSYLYPYAKFVNLNWRAQESELNGIYKEYIWIDIFPADSIPESSEAQAYLMKRQKNTLRKARWSYYNPSIVIQQTHNPLKRFVKRVMLAASRQFISPEKNYAKLAERASSRTYGSTRYVGDLVCPPFKEHIPHFPAQDFENLIDMQFEGYTFKVCPHWDEYLKDLYGDYMILPPKNQRFNHSMKVWPAAENVEDANL